MSVGSSIREAVTGRPANPGAPTQEQMQNQLLAANITADSLIESMRRLEDSMEDEGWRRLGWDMEREFTRTGLEEIVKISRALYLSNPLVQRSVDVKTYYTWGQGVTHQAKDQKVQDLVVEPQTDDDANRSELYGHQAQLLTDVDQMVDGSLFVALFTNFNGDVSPRSIPVEQITEIISKEGDAALTTFYRRIWAEDIFDAATGERRTLQQEALYPDWRYQPDLKPEVIGGVKVIWEAPIIFQKTGGLKHMKFGVPETYSGMEWARAYKGFLEDWHTIVKSLSRFAWTGKTKPKKIKGLKTKLEKEGKGPDEDESEESETGRRRKRIGDVFLGKEGDELSPIQKSGATISADDARPSRLMVAAGAGLPDTILSGDVDIGNFATSKTLDRPTELMMVGRQTMWTDFHQNIWRYAIDCKVRSLDLPGKQVKNPRTGMNMIIPAVDAQVDVTFPPILEHDTKANIEAVVAAATLMGKSDAGTMPPELVSKLMMEALGIDDIEQALKEIPEPEVERVEEALKSLEEAIRGQRA